MDRERPEPVTQASLPLSLAWGLALYCMALTLLIFAANFSTSKFIYVDF